MVGLAPKSIGAAVAAPNEGRVGAVDAAAPKEGKLNGAAAAVVTVAPKLGGGAAEVVAAAAPNDPKPAVAVDPPNAGVRLGATAAPNCGGVAAAPKVLAPNCGGVAPAAPNPLAAVPKLEAVGVENVTFEFVADGVPKAGVVLCGVASKIKKGDDANIRGGFLT